MKRYIITCILLTLLLGIYPMSVEAKKLDLDYKGVIKVNDYYQRFMDTNEDEPVHKIKITNSGWYKVSVTFRGIYDENGNNVANETDYMYYTLYNGSEETENEVHFGNTSSDIVGFENGNAYIKINDFAMISDYEISYVIRVTPANKKNVPFTKMSNSLKKSDNKYREYKDSKTKTYLKFRGLTDTDHHEEHGYSLGFVSNPRVQISKQKKSSCMTYDLSGIFFCYSIPEMEDSDLTTLILGNTKKKISYDLDYSNEENWYSYKDYFYKDECEWKCTIFNSYTATEDEINELIKVINSSGAYIKITGEADAYYKVVLSSEMKSEWVESLKIYKKLLKNYQ